MKEKQFLIPRQRDLENIFRQRFLRDLSPQEQNVMDFFYSQTEKALGENMGDDRLKLCATMILMLSPARERKYCLENNSFGADEKRNKFARTIEAIFTKNVGALNELIQESNTDLTARLNQLQGQANDRFFNNVNLNQNEQAAMQQFCTDYTILLAKDIAGLFNSEEMDLWRSSGLPVPHALLNHQEDRLRMLGHSAQEIQNLTSAAQVPAASALNPYSYNLRSRGVNKEAAQEF